MRIDVLIESTPTKSFASAAEWPGWSRAGRTPELALEALVASAPRYALVAGEAGIEFDAVEADDLVVIERSPGDASTAFGVPHVIFDADGRPVAANQAKRLVSLVAASWRILDGVVSRAPAELRKGPRGGGRDRDKIFGHVVEADGGYEREIGLRLPVPAPDDRRAVEAFRDAMLDVLREPSDGSPIAGRKWTPRYAARRIAWHALDHAWEIEDRTESAP